MKEITKRIVELRDERDWKQFHTPKDMALSLVLEAAEVLEHFQWKTREDVEEYIKTHKAEIGDELADVLCWVLLMCNDLDIDIYKASLEKMEKTEKKYPIDKAKGRADKYNKL
ncbi:nucleotide pyrophosphohydrolase [Candidatus Parcubacteria bacterium]|nr:nucleotide pyrophosphohydrolase [Candidatus Parcubacteria bacterium]